MKCVSRLGQEERTGDLNLRNPEENRKIGMGFWRWGWGAPEWSVGSSDGVVLSVPHHNLDRPVTEYVNLR